MPTCCVNCFSDNYLRTRIQSIGKVGNCDYCGSKNITSVDLVDIAKLFEPLITLYTPTIEYKSIEELKEGEYSSQIWDCIEGQWQILSDLIYKRNSVKIFYQDLLRILEIEDKYIENNVGIDLDYYGISDVETGLFVDMWENFSDEIKNENRFFISSDENKFLLKKISEFSEYLVVEYKKGLVFFRARLNSSRHKLFTCVEDMEPPPADKCVGGRANPTGIPYFYIATNPKTAIGEIEPLLSDSVTMAEFELKENIKIIKLSRPISPFIFENKLSSFYPYYDFLVYLGIQLSIPYSKKNEPIEYIPTQYLCEYFKYLGYSGVQYQSLKGNGENLVIFNKNYFKCKSIHGFYINDISYKTKPFPIEV